MEKRSLRLGINQMNIINKEKEIPEQFKEIAKDFKGITKNRSIKIGFLKKHARTNLFVSKVTGKIIPQKIKCCFVCIIT